MRFQFSLRWIFAATMVVAGAAGLWGGSTDAAQSSWQFGLAELVLVFYVPAFAAVASLGSKGSARAFWIGVLISTVLGSFAVLLVMLPGQHERIHNGWRFRPWEIAGFLNHFSYSRRWVLGAWALALVVGLLCLVARWLLFGKKSKHRGLNNLPNSDRLSC